MPLSKLTELQTFKRCQLDHNEVSLKKQTKPKPKKQGADQWERGGKNPFRFAFICALKSCKEAQGIYRKLFPFWKGGGTDGKGVRDILPFYSLDFRTI